MAHRKPIDQLYRDLLLMHQEAFASARYELGYHLLAAAVHAAEELNSVELLSELGTLAEARQREMDALRPEHRLSSPAAQRRGNYALYTALSAIAAAAKGRIAADQARMRTHSQTSR